MDGDQNASQTTALPGLEQGMNRWDSVALSAGLAHVLTWAAGLFLAFGPVYRGVSTSVSENPGGFSIESARTTETLLDVNGLSVLPLLVAPVVVTAIVVATVMTTRPATPTRKVSLWVAAVLLLGFCAAGVFSIGVFYVPAAVSLMVAAIMGSRRVPVGEP